MPEPNVQLLAERVARLDAEAAIRATLARYGHAIDAGDDDGWVDLFTETGEFQVRGPSSGSGDDYTVVGRVALREFYSHHSRRPEAFHEHVTVQPVITLADDGQHASCTSRFFVIMDAARRPAIRVFGTYHDTLERGADGVWRFATRRPEIDAQASDLPALAYSR